MRREEYDLKKMVVSFNGVPVPGLADADGVIVFAFDEDLVGEPQIDYTGLVGRHVVNNRKTGTVTIIMSPSDTIGTQILMGYHRAGVAITSIAANDLSSASGAAVANDCRLKTMPPFSFGKTPEPREWVFSSTWMDINHDGPRVSPV